MIEKTTANSEIKQKNHSNIYRLLRQNGNLSRQDIVQRLNLSLPTVTQNLDEMQGEHLVIASGTVGNTGGRRAKTYSVVDDAKLAIGLDITRNHITAVLIDLHGRVIQSRRYQSQFALTDRYYKELAMAVGNLIRDTQTDENKILGVGIGVPGLVTEDHQTVFWGGPLNFTGATCSDFSRYISFPSTMHNDANAAGFAEIWEHHDIKNAFYLMLSNFIGGSVLINNQIYPGESIRGGEIGHLTIVPKGKDCYCGQHGHVDPYCAATVLSDLTDGNLERFFREMKNGNPALVTAFHEYLEYLAITVINLRVLFDCSIILGGYVGAYMEDHLQDLREMVCELNPFEKNADFIKACRYKTEAIAAGSALYYVDHFISSI